MKWLVKQEWKYTVDVEVEADTEQEALSQSDGMEGDRNHDDTLVDATARKAE